MTSFIIRKIDPNFWARVRAKADAEGVSVKDLILRLLGAWLAAVAILSTIGCGGDSPTAPTPPPPTPPAPVTFTLTGTVTSTTGLAINGATVRIADSANAGRSTTTAGGGTYSLASLTASGFTVNVTAPNYIGTSDGVTLTSNQTVNFRLAPTPLFTAAGIGDTVFDMPTSVARVRITATPTTSCQNFVVRIGGRTSIINVILGTCSVADARSLDSTYLTGGGGVVEIRISTGVRWTFTEVR
jgi:hypothetical protein